MIDIFDRIYFTLLGIMLGMMLISIIISDYNKKLSIILENIGITIFVILVILGLFNVWL